MPRTRRLFIALWPTASTREACAADRDAWLWSASARPTDDASLHVTLVFIGAVAEERVDALVAAIAVDGAAFALRFDRRTVWRNGIAALEPATSSRALTRLQALLVTRVDAFGLSTERRRYRPHVTLARDARGSTAPGGAPSIGWPVDGFVLVESRGGRYVILRHYALRAAPCE